MNQTKTNIKSTIPDWVVYPDEEWIKITPAQAGFDATKFNQIIVNSHPKGGNFWGEVHEENEWGGVLTRGGYLAHTWGNPDYKYQSASLGKAFTWAALGLAVDESLINPDDLISQTWTGERQLSHPHKYLNSGHHQKLTWRQLVNHQGGFVLENGYHWKTRAGHHVDLPPWASWTGDAFYDNYSHNEPGTITHYSSGGFCRLGQALTALWNRDLKQVLDEKLLSHIGIPADQWEWLPGGVVHFTTDFYPAAPGYGEYVDPPYYINGNVVRGGPGWIVMSPKDLARFGLLVATGGIWQGKRLISPEWIRGHGGGNSSWVTGDRDTYISLGYVTAQGIPSVETFKELIIAPVVGQ